MRLSYECGAQYVVVFNYAENMTDAYGILQDEHFQALERFWNTVVQNPNVKHGGVKAEAALVLPDNYGWGMRSANDSIWSLWKPDVVSEQIWTQLQSKLEQYGATLDIVYNDSSYSLSEKYSQIFYWNQSGAPITFPLIIGIMVVTIIVASVTIIAKRRQKTGFRPPT